MLDARRMKYSKLTYDNQANFETPKMFRFIRELNMIYADEKDDEFKDSDSLYEHLNLHDMPVYKSFEFIDNAHESKGFREKERTSFKLNRNKNQDRIVKNKTESNLFPNPDNPLQESEGSRARRKVYLKRDLAEDFNMPEMVAFFQDSNYNLFKDIFMESESTSHQDSELDSTNILSSMLDNDNDDSESSDSTTETLARLSCIANELELEAQNNEQRISRRFSSIEDEEDFEDAVEDLLMIDHDDTVHLIKYEYKDQSEMLINGNDGDFDGSDSDNSEDELLQNGYKRLTMDDEDDFDGGDDDWIDNPADKILRSYHQAYKEIPSKEPAEDSDQVLETDKPENSRSPERSKSRSQSLNRRDHDGDSSSIEADDPHSGPISLKSSSSTASAYSFAFPIMVAEWTGSPAAMVNADRKQWQPTPIVNKKRVRRQSRWRVLACCKTVKEE
ncbi:uncharacterized protein LOC126671068 [Mercurialis annua]|uniref:uncharacterized protein LOC126671068 n=1 Tax=Mercurialis annua TaxID=3986 RepID=UPI0021607EB9|nr:uncharacterized protein LOC126671068 [Mercurialis annua]XP_055961241.1 uncharacterized protein LOC126671068 [Mercurialis annua]